MSRVSQYISDLVARQVNDAGIVVWYDPERHYDIFVESLPAPDITVIRYDGSFFGLRHSVDPLLNGDRPPRLLIYVPEAQAETHNALVELETLGAVIRPGLTVAARNTRLSVVSRNALKGLIAEDKIAAIEKQVEEGKLTLADLDGLAEKGEEISNLLSLVFGTSDSLDIALTFLASSSADSDLEKKDVAPELYRLISRVLGVELGDRTPLDQARNHVAKVLLATDLTLTLAESAKVLLPPVPQANEPSAQRSSLALARTWRLRRDLRDSYVAAANRIEAELLIHNCRLGREEIGASETFRNIEEQLQLAVESELLEAPSVELPELASRRLSSFWSEQSPEIQARWAIIATAGQLIVDADRVERELKSCGDSAESIFTSYTLGSGAWCRLDTHQRHLERRWHTFDFDGTDRYRSLEFLYIRARQRYMDVGGQIAEKFVRAYQASNFDPPTPLKQTQVFEQRVKPALELGKTAYILVDALRYEMANELCESLLDDFEISLEPAIGTAPAITEIGMAALMPNAQIPTILSNVEGIVPQILGTMLRNRSERMAYIKKHAGCTVFEGKLDDILPKPSKRVREAIEAAQLVVITSQEIDALCEGDNISLARRTMDGTLHELRRAFRLLREMGVVRLVLAADHGYLFGDELETDTKIDPPGGETASLHRRVWIGRGGAAGASYMRAKLSDLGIGGGLEIAVPWNFACFKTRGGARAYFHGGLSPQEIVIPVATLEPIARAKSADAGRIIWSLAPGSRTISTRFFSVQIAGKSEGLFDIAPPAVRVEVREGSRLVSQPVSASYGFQESTGDVYLRIIDQDKASIDPDTVTLMITETQATRSASVVLLDANSGLELAKLDAIEISISL